MGGCVCVWGGGGGRGEDICLFPCILGNNIFMSQKYRSDQIENASCYHSFFISRARMCKNIIHFCQSQM